MWRTLKAANHRDMEWLSKRNQIMAWYIYILIQIEKLKTGCFSKDFIRKNIFLCCNIKYFQKKKCSRHIIKKKACSLTYDEHEYFKNKTFESIKNQLYGSNFKRFILWIIMKKRSDLSCSQQLTLDGIVYNLSKGFEFLIQAK